MACQKMIIQAGIDPGPAPYPQETEGHNPDPGTQQREEGNNDPSADTHLPAEEETITPAPQPGTDDDYILSEPDGAGDTTALDEFNEGDTLPTGDGEYGENLEDQVGPEPEAVPEEPLVLGASGVMRSIRSVPATTSLI